MYFSHMIVIKLLEFLKPRHGTLKLIGTVLETFGG
jgi:hypothetical protein